MTQASELDAFLSNESEERRKLGKQCQRAIDITQLQCVRVGVVGLEMESTEFALIATEVASVPAIVLSAVGSGVFILDLVCAALIRLCTAKVAKNTTVMLLAKTRLNSIHQNFSKALCYSKISDQELKKSFVRLSVSELWRRSLDLGATLCMRLEKKTTELSELGREEDGHF